MLRTAQLLLPKELLTLRSDPAGYPAEPPACYRASWQLPEPDLPRLATTSFSLSVQLKGITSSFWAHETGRLAVRSLPSQDVFNPTP